MSSNGLYSASERHSAYDADTIDAVSASASASSSSSSSSTTHAVYSVVTPSAALGPVRGDCANNEFWTK